MFCFTHDLGHKTADVVFGGEPQLHIRMKWITATPEGLVQTVVTHVFV